MQIYIKEKSVKRNTLGIVDAALKNVFSVTLVPGPILSKLSK